LLEVSGKMTKRQLQVFQEDLKVGHHKQKLPAKQAILEALRKPMEPNNWCVLFFSQLCIIGFFFVL
jgi:hypothetical protein